MKSSLKAFIAAVTAIVTSVSCVLPAFAEGSKDLASVSSGTTEAYRPYLEWRDRLQMGDVESKSVVYVYANAGETIYFGTSV